MNRQSSAASILSSGDFCRICHCDSSCGELISPCYCAGSLRWVHQICLQHWIRASNSKACELCRYPFIMKTQLKPLYEWEILPMTNSEKRRSICSAFFHILALSCVVWSLYVLIERTVVEFQQAELEWQFWTKIVVETIGCIGAFILVWVWGKTYISLIRKWIAFNRTFVITNAIPAPVKQKSSSCNVATICPTTKSTSTCATSTPPLYHNCPTDVVAVMNSPTNTNATVAGRYCCPLESAALTATETVAIVANNEDRTEREEDTLNMDNDCEAKPLLLQSSQVFTEDIGGGDTTTKSDLENT